MLVILGIVALTVVLILTRVLRFVNQRETHLGWVSERWIAEYRASQQR